jgi:hypothetical protein
MKKQILTAVLATALFAPAAFAETPNLKSGTMALSVPMSGDFPTISGRFFLNDGLAITGDLGFASVDNGPGSDKDSVLAIGAGLRKYLKSADVSPFAGAKFKLISSDAGDTVEFGVEAGAEAFLLKNFSIEGAVGFGYRSVEVDATGAEQDVFGTQTFEVRMNYYF